MKKLTQLSIVALSALAIVACDNKDKTANEPIKTTKEATITADQQFRQDFEVFEQLRIAANERIQNEVTRLQQKLTEVGLEKELTSEEIEKLTQSFREGSQQVTQALESIEFKDTTVSILASKLKQIQQVARETIDLTIQVASQPNNSELMSKLSEKVNELDKLKREIGEELDQANQKYSQQQ